MVKYFKGDFMGYVIETNNLIKTYGAKRAVDRVSVHIGKGEIYGLIGKNGAGKTTLMKTILGLTFQDEGEIRLFDSVELNKQRARIGALIENPGLYTSETAYGNLKLFGMLTGNCDEEINNILKLVGLEGAGRKKVKAFSLGMKQRLGIAIALLGNPELLVLDEPVNGLDPSGIKEVRDLLLDLNSKGVTVFISSHLIDELGKIATKFGIMRDGALVEEITKDELLSACTSFIEITVDDAEAARRVIAEKVNGAEVKVENGVVRVDGDEISTAELNRMLAAADISVSELKHEKVSFEDFFIQRMG